ncbi:MAG: hypothetical protein IPH07_24285 [Deltaproteobacteria bacterium]|nr:hypothetical protein [Deltaproteobacteria bacterium]
MTPEQLALVVELHNRIAELARRSPTLRVVLGPRVLALLQRIKETQQ